jgi:hypothetical protein
MHGKVYTDVETASYASAAAHSLRIADRIHAYENPPVQRNAAREWRRNVVV